ncbi:hypothetical protein ABT084_29615, partial [Streptomyces sp. NPDC002138]
MRTRWPGGHRVLTRPRPVGRRVRPGYDGLPLGEKGSPSAEVLCEWVEESYRTVALKRHVK